MNHAEHPGPLALVGGGEWRAGCGFDEDLLAAAAVDEVLVLPTAAAYEQPGRAVETATAWFARLGARVRGLMVLGRRDAENAEMAAVVRDARFIYLGGGSPLHLKSVLKDSAVFYALVDAWRAGAVLAGSSAGAMVLGDPMVDPRGGAFTLGLGVIENLAVLPEAASWSSDRLRRTIHLVPPSTPLLVLDEQTAAVRAPAGGWALSGAGGARVFVGGIEVDPSALP